mgnify:CR=1 FL=1
MTIYKIKFKRTKESEWESGIKLHTKDESKSIYLDKEGNILKTHDCKKWVVWDLNEYDHFKHFCIDLTLILKD